MRQGDELTERPIVIGPPETTTKNGLTRITADIDGSPVWFESRDVVLRANPEVWASAFFVPSLHVRRPLNVPGEVDSTWLDGLSEMLPVYEQWWQTPRRLPEIAGKATSSPPGPKRTGVFFTCGIDSFHATFRSGHEVHSLVNVQGFDVELGDARRLEGVEGAVRDTARELHLEPIIVRTNLRLHPLMIEVNWEHTHGGALAAVGHGLRGHVGKLLIGSSFPEPYSDPWGSHWKTDRLWSSGDLRFVHVGADRARVDKVQQIARERVVQKHLRVCYEHPDGRVNCSHCEKCLFTMLCLAEQGVLDDCETFDGSAHLLERLQGLPWMRWRHKGLKRLSHSKALDPALRGVAAKLYRRSIWRKSGLRQAMQRLAVALGMARGPDLTANERKDAQARARYRDSE